MGWPDAEFDDFVATRSPSLVRFAYGLTGDFGHAQDLVQTALLAVYVRSRRRRPDSPEAYVRKAVLNAFLSGKRRRGVQEQLVERLPEGGTPPAMSMHEQQEAVQFLVAGLSPRQRAVLFLRYYEDWSEDQIAAALGGSEHRSSPPVAPVSPAPTGIVSQTGKLAVVPVNDSHPQYCGLGEWQSLDLSTCYAVDSQANSITGGFRVTLTVPSMPSADKVDAPIPAATLTIEPTASQRQALAMLGTHGKRFVFAAQDRPFAELSGARLDAASFRITGAPDVMEHAWDLLMGRTWSPPAAVLPPPNASPQDVVRAYIGALNRHNEATVTALRAPGANEYVPWYVENIVSITHLEVDPASVLGTTATVRVRFDLQQIRVDSQLNGDTIWGYTLTRANDHAPWRIFEEGVG